MSNKTSVDRTFSSQDQVRIFLFCRINRCVKFLGGGRCGPLRPPDGDNLHVFIVRLSSVLKTGILIGTSIATLTRYPVIIFKLVLDM